MGTHSTPRLYLKFAGAILLAMAIVGAAIVYFRLNTITDETESSAAASVTDTIEPALGPGALGAAASTIDERVLTLRLWSPAGTLLDSAGLANAAPAIEGAVATAVGGDAVLRKESTAGGDVLVSYTALSDGNVLEVQQDYAPIAGAITSNRNDLLTVTGAAAAALLLVLPIGLWGALRGLTSEHGRLLYLYRTGQKIRSSLDITTVLEQLARDASTQINAKLAFCTLLDEKTNELVLKTSYDAQNNEAHQHQKKLDDWYVRRSAATGQTVVTDQAEIPYEGLLGYAPKLAGRMLVVSVAIPGHDSPVGVLTLVRHRSQGGVHAMELHVIEELAAQAAMAVEQGMLFGKVQSYTDELELSYDSTLKVLMAAIDTKDSATQGHSERVSRLTVSLAREMGLPEEQMIDIERGALLHDVGKIGVPDEILRKPDSLDEKEWEAMQKHPLLAGLMVSKVAFLERAMPILIYHHERFDGGGYPFGLEGKAIPLEARIFTVVDSYDAMTSDRPYRKAMPAEQALEEIKRHAGTQFDPVVVEAFARVIAGMYTVRQRPAA